MRVRQRNHQNFVFASAAGYLGAANPNTVYLDGQIAYNIGQNGRGVRGTEAAASARRLDMLNNPVVIVRIALDSSTKLSNVRSQGNAQLVDVVTATDDKLTLAIDNASASARLNARSASLKSGAARYSFMIVVFPRGYSPRRE